MSKQLEAEIDRLACVLIEVDWNQPCPVLVDKLADDAGVKRQRWESVVNAVSDLSKDRAETLIDGIPEKVWHRIYLPGEVGGWKAEEIYTACPGEVVLICATGRVAVTLYHLRQCLLCLAGYVVNPEIYFALRSHGCNV